MKKLNKFFRKAAVFLLIACMMLSVFPASFADMSSEGGLSYEQLMLLRAMKREEEYPASEQAAAFAVSYNQETVYTAPVYETPVFETPVFEAPVYKAPVNETPVFEAPVYEAPVFEETESEAFVINEFDQGENFENGFFEEEPVEEFVEEKPVEEFVEEEPVEEFVEEKPVEEFVEEKPVEEFVEEEPVEEFVEEKPVEEFVEEKPVEEFVEEKPVGEFVEEKPVEEFVEEKPVEEFVEEEPVGEFVEEKPVEEFVEEEPVEEFVEEKPVEEFVEEKPVEEFVEEEPVEEFVEEEPVEEFVEEKPVEEFVEEAVEEVETVEGNEKAGYTVEFCSTSGEEFVLQGDASAPLEDILSIIGHGDIDVSQIAEVVSSDDSLFSAEQDENGVWVIKTNKQFATDQKMTLVMADGSTVEIFVTDDCKVAKFNGTEYKTLEAALAAANGNDDGGTITLLEDITSGNIVLNVIKNIIIDFNHHFINVNKTADETADDKPVKDKTVAVKFDGGGSLTLTNGTLKSTSDQIETVVESSANKLTIKDMLIQGLDTIKGAVLSITGGNAEITGHTTIDSGSNSNIAIAADDTEKDTSLFVNTTGIILGKVAASDVDHSPTKNTDVLLHNGFYSGKIISDKANVAVDGGNYLTNVYRYVDRNTDYAEIVNPYGRIFSAGKNIPWSARFSSMRAPTLVNVLKSDGSIRLPFTAAVKNSVRDKHFIFVNGRPLIKGGLIPFNRHFCCSPCKGSGASVIDGANSIWYKGTKDGLTYELSGDISYVTVDGAKVSAIIDGVYAELEAETLEALKAGTHTVKFILKNGCAATTNLKVVPDDNVVWTKGSQNGLKYEMTGKIKKVLIDHVKIDAEIYGKDASVSASVLQDLKTGNHTVEFVLESGSHVVTSITVK